MTNPLCKPNVLFSALLLLLNAGFAFSAKDQGPRHDTSVPPRTDQYGDPLPPGGLARIGPNRLHHSGPVFHVAVSCDGKVVISDGEDGLIRLWDMAGGKLLRQYPYSPAEPLAISADGNIRAVATRKNDAISLLDMSAGKEILRLNGHNSSVRRMAFSPDGSLLGSVTADHMIRLWSLPQGKEFRKLTQLKRDVDSLAFSPNAKMLAYGVADSIEVVDLTADRPFQSIQIPKAQSRALARFGVTCLAFSPDGKTLAGGTSGQEKGQGMVSLWDVTTGNLLHQLPGYDMERTINCVAFSPDGTLLAAAAGHNSVSLWQTGTGKLHCHLVQDSFISSVCFAPDGRTLISGGSDGQVRLWNVQTGKERRQPQRSSGEIRSVAYAPNGQTLATLGGNPFGVRLWDSPTGKFIRFLPQPDDTNLPRSCLDWGGDSMVFHRWLSVVLHTKPAFSHLLGFEQRKTLSGFLSLSRRRTGLRRAFCPIAKWSDHSFGSVFVFQTCQEATPLRL